MNTVDMLSKLKIALDISDDTQDDLLTLLIERTLDKVLSNINKQNLPRKCVSLVVEMAEDAYKLLMAGRNESAGEITGSVSTVSDIGQSVSYRNSDYTAVLKTVSDNFLKNYDERLAPFRRPRW